MVRRYRKRRPRPTQEKLYEDSLYDRDSSYGAPANSYSAPDNSYSAPSYGAPASSYEAPSYSSPTYGG